MNERYLALLALLFCACGDVRSASSPGDGVRLVTIGDNAAAGPTYNTSYVSLLIENDDELFGAFSGRDFSSRLGRVDAVRLDRAGDGYRSLAQSTDAPCICQGEACPAQPCIDTEDERPTIVIVQLGIYDLYTLFLRMPSDPALRRNPDAVISSFRTNVRSLLERLAKAGITKHPTAVVNVYDPTDGGGNLVELASQIIPLPEGAEEITPQLVNRIVAGFNQVIAEEAENFGAMLIDVHDAFLGHGLLHLSPEYERHAPKDPSYWYRGFLDPNLRGAHEIRRAIWQALTNEVIDEHPEDLPPEGTLGLPQIPDDGWASGLAAARIQAEVDVQGVGLLSNAAGDPRKALGPPGQGADEGLNDIVAIGTIGHHLVLDLGKRALDGEGMDLVILEFGPLQGGTPEPYRVFVSSEEDGPEGPFELLGDAAGEAGFDFGERGIRSARYVRLESLVHPIDLGALGSPFYPGPEINAVGAVYPSPP